MPRGQFWTVFTLGFAVAIGFLGVAAAVALLFWRDPYWQLVSVAHGQLDWLSPVYLSLIVAGAAVFVAYWIVQIQQTLIRWLADREIAKLSAEYRAIAQAQGSALADEYMRQKVIAMFAGEDLRYDLFGRQELLRALAADGIRIPSA